MTNLLAGCVLAAVCTVVLLLPGATQAMGEDRDSARVAFVPSDIPGPPNRNHYYLAAADGGVFAFGDARFYGSMAGRPLAAPIVDIETTEVDTGGFLAPPGGYYLAAADGGVFAFGGARFYGSMAGRPLAAPIVAIVATPSREGYWLMGRDGGAFAFGDAKGFVARTPLDAPIVDAVLVWTGSILASVQSAEYDARYYGAIVVNAAGATLVRDSTRTDLDPDADLGGWRNPPPADSLAAPIVAVAEEYVSSFWLAAADGGVFALGTTPFLGSMAGKRLNAPIVDIIAAGLNYLLAAADGGVFAFGNAPFLGSMAGKPLNAPVIGMS